MNDKLNSLLKAMMSVNQTENQTILEHGESVWRWTQRILNKDLEHLKLPQCFLDNYDFILNNICSRSIIEKYTVYHDCGKPYCLEIDNEGKQHFPNHAEVSKKVYLDVFRDSEIIGTDTVDNDLIAFFIEHDMCLHTETAEQIKNHNWDITHAFTLLIVTFAEIHSNAIMFGGIESISFKIKWKKLSKRAKMLLKLYKDEN